MTTGITCKHNQAENITTAQRFMTLCSITVVDMIVVFWFRVFVFCIASLLSAVSFSKTASSDCPRGSLDVPFCDADNDLLADVPKNSAEWIDPYPLVFAYSPVEDPIVYKDAWSDFIDHMAQVTGRKVVLFPIQTNSAEIEAMRAGKIHVAGFNSGSNPLAVNCAGFRPFTLMAKKDGSFGYKMEVITYPGSGIDSINDIKGKLLAFTSPTSNSGFKAASAILKDEFDLMRGRDFRFTFSGRHDESILGVKNKIYSAATIANSVRKRMLKRGLIKDNDVSVIYQSKVFPNTGFGYAHNLNPVLVSNIKKAFKTFKWDRVDGTPSSLKSEFLSSEYAQFVPVNYKKEWEVIRAIDSANNTSYSCR